MGAKPKVFSADGDQPHKRDLKNLDRRKNENKNISRLRHLA